MSKAAQPTQHPDVVVYGQSTVDVVPDRTGGASDLDGLLNSIKKASIAIIVIHIVGLAAYGFYFWSQIVVTLFALIVGVAVLCTRALDKCGYTVVAALYSLGVVGNVWRLIEWFLFVEYVNEDSTDYDSQYDSADDEVWWIYAFALPNALGAVLFLVGAVCALKATRKWPQSSTLPI